MDRARIEAQASRNLVEHLRMCAHIVGLDGERGGATEAPASLQLLVALLKDKQSQSLERAFRLLKIAHKREDIHRVHIAAMSTDRRVRSNAGEFLDSLLSGGDRRTLRDLFDEAMRSEQNQLAGEGGGAALLIIWVGLGFEK